MSKTGRPPKFTTKEELEKAIDEYFDNCPDTRTVFFKTKDDVIDKQVPHPTISGLALYLGFASRQSLYDYEQNDEFTYTIKKARLFCENAYEKQLFDNPTGAIFALKNLGWSDKTELTHKGNLFTDWLNSLDD